MTVCVLVLSARDLELLPLAAALAHARNQSLMVLQANRRRGAYQLESPLFDEDQQEDAIVRRIREFLDEHVVGTEPADSDDAISDSAPASSEPESQPTAVVEASEVSDAQSKVSEQPTEGADEPQATSAEPSRRALAGLPGFEFYRLTCDDVPRGLVHELGNHRVRTLFLPRHEMTRGSSADDTNLERYLFQNAPCEVLYLRWNSPFPARCRRILVASRGSGNASVAVARAEEFARLDPEARVTVLYVEPAVDEVAALVGERILTRLLRRSLGTRPDHVEPRVEVADDLHSGILRALDEPCELLLLGASERREAKRLLFGKLSEQQDVTGKPPAVGVVRSAIPLAGRLRQWLERLLQDRVPQLSRDNRVSLVERVQSSSQWDFDFTALICLSTLIAALGLLQDSAAVVIGAMLVAPLMTPLIATGLAVVQGNVLLLRTGTRSVAQGFMLAFFLAWLVGIVMGWTGMRDPTPQMWARSSPNILDLIVAFVSGLAAAYAMGRPNLTSALPGVAIAAALVPPIATSAMAASWGYYSLATGALLLFLTNIVAIVLATSVTLWAAGIRDTHRHGTRQGWSRRAALALSLLAVALAVYESFPHDRLTPELREQFQTVASGHQARIAELELEEHHGRSLLHIVLEHPTGQNPQLFHAITALTRQQLGAEAEVRLELRIVHYGGGPRP